jgi:hypothetical protein
MISSASRRCSGCAVPLVATADGVAEPPEEQVIEDRGQVRARRCELVPNLSTSDDPVDLDESVLLEVTQALNERLGRDAGQTLDQVGETPGDR